ncbi:MAG: CRISPR-associated helicase Cas3' [Mycolicibacterium sp.]|nr:CRISPR-associated helicase Cas3' [Mycolicibacterium sp.]
MHDHLSRRLLSCWAKSDDEERSLSLVAHAADSCAVAGYLYDNWLPRSVRRLIAGRRSDDEARSLVRWLAACHDTGKASPAFACQVPHLANLICDTGLAIDVNLSDKRRREFPHSLVSQLALESYLAEHAWTTVKVNGRRTSVARSYAVVPGGHHGVPPTSTMLIPKSAPAMLGGPPWDQVRREFIEFTCRISGADRYLDAWRDNPLTPQQQAVATGIVIVADWLASNTGLFPLGEPRDSDSHAAEVLDRLALPHPWPATPVTDTNATFERFHLPADATPNPVQTATVDLTRRAGSHGLIIVEGPMGSGKTEAALMAAQQFGYSAGTGGVFFALPTMATANAMFTRELAWLRAQPGLEMTSALLVHSKAELNEDFRGLMYGGTASDIDRDGDGCESTVIAHQWLSGRKKGMLSNFVVGTIDQLLFMALQARHLALRHLAFAGKVVVIDEVHAADTYMRQYLKRALEWLGAYQVPVIMLSATLPVAQRVSYAEAYTSGMRYQPANPLELRTEQYPVITGVLSDGAVRVLTPALPLSSSRVRIERLPDDRESLVRTLDDLLSDGGCAVVIRNTVRRAQETARALREKFDDDVRLLHSSFIAQHRSELERELIRELGRGSADRPYRRIIVATQVVEQSLDVDFDVMVTDVAPIDLILQRVGRLHRHERERPAKVREPLLFLTGVEDWAAPVPQPIRSSSRVYQRYDLLRGLAVLRGQNVIEIPSGIAPLVHGGYCADFVAPNGWEQDLTEAKLAAANEAAELAESADAFRIWEPHAMPTLVGWLDDRGDDPEDPRGYARVRNSNDSIEVIVTCRRGDDVYLPLHPDHEFIEVLTEPDGQKGQLALTSTIKLPYLMSLPWILDPLITELEKRTHRYAGWRTSKWLKGELALELDNHMSTQIYGFDLRYDERDGLIVERSVDAR